MKEVTEAITRQSIEIAHAGIVSDRAEVAASGLATAYVGVGAGGAALYAGGIATGVATGASAALVGAVAAPLVVVGGVLLIAKSASWSRKTVRENCVDEMVRKVRAS